MWNQRIAFSENTYYHLANCWFWEEILFHDAKELDKFYNLLIKYLNIYKNIQLISFCIMGDYFHFVIKNKLEWYEISEFMKRLQWAYATSFRKKYKSPGRNPVFKWRFKAKKITSKDEFDNILSYVNYIPEFNNKLEYKYCSINKLLSTGPKEFLENKVQKLDYINY